MIKYNLYSHYSSLHLPINVIFHHLFVTNPFIIFITYLILNHLLIQLVYMNSSNLQLLDHLNLDINVSYFHENYY